MEFEETCRFRSDFYHDLTLHKEFNRGSMDGNLLFQGLHLILSGVLIWFFVEMVLFLDAAEAYAEAVPGITAVWLVVELLRFLGTRGGGIHFKRSLMLNGGKPTHDSVFFCDDAIHTLEQESGNRSSYSYEIIRIVYETENLYLLGMKYGVFLLVDKRTLTGTREEFGRFLFEKCPKLRNKKVRKCKTGRIIGRIKWIVIALSLLAALYFHPWLQLDRRIQGQLHNGMSASEMAAELESLGVVLPDDLSLEAVEDDYWFLSKSKLETLLYHAGLGDHDYENNRWTPAGSDVFFTYYWGIYPDTMYTDLLRGIESLCGGEVVIEDVMEDQSNADWANYDGFISLDFTLNGKPQHLEPVFYQEWYDEQIFNALNAMVFDATGRQLYFADFKDIGCFIFFGDDAWADAFVNRSGMNLSSNITDIY